MTYPPSLSVLIPAYNERDGLTRGVELVRAQLAALGVEAEIIVVDDGSTDGTAGIADALAVDHAGVRALHHAANQGIGGAFRTGVANACGEWLILIPADVALDPNDLHKYLDAAPTADIVVGNRSDLRDYSRFRRLVHYANIRLLQALFRMPLRQFQYISLYRLKTLRQMEIEFTGSAFFLAEVLIKAHALGARLAEVEIRYLPRATGHSSGARPRLIAATVFDMLRFWWRWAWRGPLAASRPCQPAPR